ncbi:MAG: alpha-rhamnosidase [Chitinophagaceae bacterium BSSC1]|nr:MAG: alpha-rhamnosidase [Chitinophagaceae bacterium BSSC1]
MMLKRYFLLTFLVLTAFFSEAQKATWIWYPGDYEIWLSNQMQNRRTDRGSFFPVFWKVDAHYVLMDFHKDFETTQAEQVSIFTEGTYNVKLDGQLIEGQPKTLLVPAGKHRINIKVFSQATVPAVFVQGKTIVSDASWLVTFEDKEWIDETGKTSDISATKWLQAGSWNFNDPKKLPSQFKLPTSVIKPVSGQVKGNEFVLDFGKETFGFIKLHGLSGKGKLTIYYGESKEEAMSNQDAVTIDVLQLNGLAKKDSVMPLSKAFRYARVVKDPSIQVSEVTMLHEYADLKERGSFTCSDPEINRIYEVAKYTLHLNSREFFIDGIKRDRWVWSGDAYQSYLMNYYLYFDNPTVSRTILALRGKDPVTGHVNTIMDYTFYWFLSIYDYYQYSGDKTFITQFYPRMQSLMDYCLGRRNKDGFMEGLPGDWVFVDWADKLSKKGALSFEQLLFCRSLETMAICAKLVNDNVAGAKYEQEAAQLKTKLMAAYWNPSKQAMVHSLINGAQSENVTRYTNMFAIFFDYFNQDQKVAVKQSVLLNDKIQKITTPYMRFYELEALCAMGEQKFVTKEIKDYWGGMLALGATSFWEEYNPTKKGAEHYAMYGREFGKSLCHAWGASPIYLLGKYYLGVKPTSPGYATYAIDPALGGLEWMQGKVPTPNGEVELYCNKTEIKLSTANAGVGTLTIKSKTLPVSNEGTIVLKANQTYELQVAPGKQYRVSYSAL